jgi:hypothetical protein
MDNIGYIQGLFGQLTPFRPADPNAFGYDPSVVNTENYNANLRFYNEQKAREKGEAKPIDIFKTRQDGHIKITNKLPAYLESRVPLPRIPGGSRRDSLF